MKLQKWMPFRFQRPETGSRPVASKADRPIWADPLATIQDEMNRAFARFWREPFADFGELESWFGDHRPPYFRPVVDVVDETKGLRVEVELPGMDENDVEVAVEDGALIIRGEKRLEKETKEQGVFRIERSFGKFERSVPLPRDVDLDAIDAKFEKGVLCVDVPKKTSAPEPKKRIPIHV